MNWSNAPLPASDEDKLRFGEFVKDLNQHARHKPSAYLENGCIDELKSRLSWEEIESLAQRHSLQVYLAVPGDRWDEGVGGYWRVIHVSVDDPLNHCQAIVQEDCDSPHMVCNFGLFHLDCRIYK